MHSTFHIIVPMEDRHEKPVNLKVISSEILRKFGGYTAHFTEGEWRSDNGRVELDKMVEYRVIRFAPSLTVSDDLWKDWKTIAELAKHEAKQKSILVWETRTGKVEHV